MGDPVYEQRLASRKKILSSSTKLRYKVIVRAHQTLREIEEQYHPLSPEQSIVLRQFQQEISKLDTITKDAVILWDEKERFFSREDIPALREIPQNILNLVKQSAYYNPEIANRLQPTAKDIHDQIEKMIKAYNNVRRSRLIGTHRNPNLGFH